MSSPQIERKLAAIMFTDIAGYTAQMSKDEAVAISLLNKKESVLKPLIAKHNGTYVKSTGDGSLSHFNSAVDAATCAKRFQESIYDDKDLNVRIGVHLGDTIFEKGDIRGDGVNIASRLENMAVEGGVFVSKEVHDQLANQKEFEGVSLGLQSMKGVGRLIEVYGLKGDKLSEPNPNEYQDNKINKYSDDEVPSIAIIPFENKGADEDVFYAYGISADLISDCSGAGLIRVAGLNDIEKLDFGNLKYEELAKSLFVRYISTGSLWKMGEMFQLSIELYDTKDKKVVWSDRWQEKWDNLPTIKSSLSDGLLKALDTKPIVAKKVDTTNTQAYEYYLKGKYKFEKKKNVEDINIARGLLQKAIELDDKLIVAKILLGFTYSQISNYDKAMGIYLPALKQAENIQDRKSEASCIESIGGIYLNKGNYDKALEYVFRSIQIQEEINDKLGIGRSLAIIGIIYFDKGDYDRALDYYNRSLEIRKNIGYKLGIAHSLSGICTVYGEQGDLDKSKDYCIRALKIREEMGAKSAVGTSYHNLGASFWFTGDYEKALDYSFIALQIDEELDRKSHMSIVLINIANIFADIEEYEKAIGYYTRSLKIREKLNDRNSAGHLLMFLYNTYKKMGKAYDLNDIYNFLEEGEFLNETCNYTLFELLEDTTYLEAAYNQVQEKADNLEPDVAAKFLSYPIPKAIVEEWEKVK